MGGPLGNEDHRRKNDEGHGKVGGHELGGQALDDHRGTQQRLCDDEDAGDHRGTEQRQVATTVREDGDQADRADQRTDEDGRGQPMGVLDPGVEIGRRQPVAEAERPVRAAESRVGGPHQAAHGDQDEGRDGSGDRQLGESGQDRVPLTAHLGPGERAPP